MSELTTAQEFRTAAKRLRCEHSFPVQPPEGTLWAPGPCANCGTPWNNRLPVSDQLRESLAALLEDLSRLAVVHPIDPDYAGMPVHRWCVGCNNEECDSLQVLDRARELVSALDGTTSSPAPAPVQAEAANGGDAR